MKKIKRMCYRTLSAIISLMLILTCFSVLASIPQTTVSAINNTGIEIRSYFIELISGAELENGSYIWKADSAEAGHLFAYRINYELSGEGDIEKGKMNIVVPRSILIDRDGNYADNIEFSIPSVEEADASQETNIKFAYYDHPEESEQIIITNYKDISSAQNGFIELGYSTSKTTYYYTDMGQSEPFRADMTIERNNDTISAQSDRIPVIINTAAGLVSTQKYTTNTLYRSWQSSWGRRPADYDDYYYTVWRIESITSATQPYNFTIDDVLDDPDTEVFGYKLAGETSFSEKNTAEFVTSVGKRTDYVLTRHLKETYRDDTAYTLTNTETATVTPYDRIDDETSAVSTASYDYVPAFFVKPIAGTNSAKYGNNNWPGYWPVVNYALNDLQTGYVDHLNGNIKFNVWFTSYPYPYTMEQGADPEDHESYGKKNVAYELTDERFYLEQPIVSVPDVMNGTEEVRQLTCDDYEIEYVDFRTSMSDAEYDTKLMKFITKPVEYTQDDIIHIYAKANGSDEWAEAATYSLFSGELWYDNTYVSGLTEERIVFKPNCTGYRFTASNAHYYTSISATPYCRIKNSGYVMQQIEDKERVTLGNIASVRFTDHAGNVFYSRDMYAEDYIIGIVRESLIEKTTTSFSNNKIKKYVTVGWRINANESYMTNDGRRYIPQESGTFYDLLPLGCDLVRTSVLVKTERGFLPSNAYDVSSRINYNGTGRILLTVHIKEQFERAELLFSTTYTYENILDYGKTLNNSAAFETGNDRIANGQPDNGGNLTDKSYMTDLDPETDEPLFIYTQHSYNIRILTAATSGLTKTVKGTNEDQYVESTKVRQNGEYSYKLRYATTTYTRAKDMVLFDSLENFSLGGTAGDWHGVLTSVDVTQVTDKGAAPVIYFSSVEDLDINSHNDLEEEISGERVWIKASRFGDISRARAVAVDMRKDAGGNDFILDRNSSVAVILYMKAPEEDNTGVSDPTTYNNIFMKDTLINMLSDTEESFFIHYEHAEVHFRIMADVSMLKLDSSDHKTPVGGIEFTLSSPTGKTDYGTDFPPISKTTDKYGRLSFADIEKGTYILSETAGSDDYLQNIEAMEVVIDGRGTVTIKGSEIDPDVPQIIEDDPRVHTDIEFYKRDLKNRKIVHGSEFVLSGKSIYGTDVYVQAVSDENGCVFFPNIEESDTNGYELREVKAADGYVRSETVFTVMIDDNANYSITEKDAPADGESLLLKELDGTYSVFNEPLHSFVLQKVSYMSEDIVVEGAEFRLYGYSDYGHEYDKTDTTNERGQITFDGLEAGTYTLRELAAPEGYILDSRDRTVIVTRYGECTVSDTTTDNMGRFVVTNKPDGTVTVIKKWLDNETNVSRAAKGIDAIISISSEAPENSAYFGYVISPNESNGDSYSSILTRVAPLASIISFAPYKGPRSYVTELINEGKAVRIDDETTNKQIYAWFEEDTGAVYWWTNAKTAKMSSRSHQIWNGLTNAVSIDVTDIDTSEVTDMSKLFYNCLKLQSIDISTFDTSNVNDMTLMFGEDGWNSKASLTEIIFGDSFNTSKVTSMTWMFAFCTKLSVIDLSRFDTHNVQSFNNMFLGCAITEADISSFDTSNALYMSSMFAGKTDHRTGTPRLTKIITGPGFDTSNVRSMSCMFYGQNYLDKDSVDFTNFDTRNVTDMKYMFRDCSSLDELDLSSFDTSSLNTMYGMFYNCSKLKSIDLSSFTTPELTSLYETFYGCSALEELDMSAFNTSKVTTLHGTFRGCSQLTHIYGMNGFDTSRVTTLNHTFRGCTALIDADVSRFDTSSVTNMAYAFCGCNSLPVLDVSGWDTSNVLDMAYMFDGCSTVEVLDVSGFDTRKVYQLTWSIADGYSGMGYMFRNCRNVRELDVSHFYTRSIYHMEYMFSGCASLESLDLSSFDTSNIIDMCRMFEGCSSLKTLDLSSFDVKN